MLIIKNIVNYKKKKFSKYFQNIIEFQAQIYIFKVTKQKNQTNALEFKIDWVIWLQITKSGVIKIISVNQILKKVVRWYYLGH